MPPEPDEFPFNHEPFGHQLDEFVTHTETEARCLPWEQGCGKTKPVIDSTAWLFRHGQIDGLFVLAPNGVHHNWVENELAAHFPEEYRDLMRAHVWHSKRAGTKKHKREFGAVVDFEGLAVLCMSYDAIMTERGCQAAKEFLTKRQCMYVLDEAQKIKNPGAKRTKRVLGSRDHGKFRRVLSGTLVANQPFDVYAPLKFLDPDVWRSIGCSNFAAFKAMFGVWETRQAGEQQYQHCVAYRNLHVLNEIVSRYGERILKEDVLDLPPKLYSKVYYTLSDQQRRFYREIAEEFMTFLSSGEMITAPLAIVRILRLQQITCGYLPTFDGSNEQCLLEGPNPRLETLVDVCEPIGHPAIIWARFRKDFDLITAALAKMGRQVTYINGEITGDDRMTRLRAFQEQKVQFLVASAAAIGTGVTLTAAKTVIYYNNSYSLEDRLQSEDRAHRFGQTNAVNYVDIIGQDTVDEAVVDALRTKREVASVVMGDDLPNWL